jgi:hypothetical protein
MQRLTESENGCGDWCARRDATRRCALQRPAYPGCWCIDPGSDCRSSRTRGVSCRDTRSHPDVGLHSLFLLTGSACAPCTVTGLLRRRQLSAFRQRPTLSANAKVSDGGSLREEAVSRVRSAATNRVLNRSVSSLSNCRHTHVIT